MKKKTTSIDRTGIDLLERFNAEVLYFGRKVTSKLIKIVQDFAIQKRLHPLLVIRLAEADMAEHMIAHLIYISRHIYEKTKSKKQINKIADLIVYLGKEFNIDLDRVAKEWI